MVEEIGPGASDAGAKDIGAEPQQAATQALSEPYYFVDASRYRITQPLSKQQWNRLHCNCKDAHMLHLRDKKGVLAVSGPDRMPLPPNYIKGYLDNPLIVVKPNPEALLLLNTLPGVILNYAELARDQIVANPEQVHDRFNKHFVHRWRGKHATKFRVRNARGEDESHATTGTSYSGQRRRGHWFAWYSDLPSKETGEVSCFHLEGRYQGAPALSQLGINRPADLIDFPHKAHWEEILRHLYAINFETLGRYESNRRRRERRRKPNFILSGRYNVDAAEGGDLYHVFGQHRDQQYHSVQRFLDIYKPRSRHFLVRIRWSDIVDPTLSSPLQAHAAVITYNNAF